MFLKDVQVKTNSTILHNHCSLLCCARWFDKGVTDLSNSWTMNWRLRQKVLEENDVLLFEIICVLVEFWPSNRYLYQDFFSSKQQSIIFQESSSPS